MRRAANKSGAATPGVGSSSITSKPMMFFVSAVRLRIRSTSYHPIPPGSGVPTEGMMDGSKASRSKLT